MKRRDDVPIEQFRKFWDSPEFNDLIDRMLGHALFVDVKKNLTLDIDLNRALQAERGAKPSFDAVMEIILQAGVDVTALLGNAEFQRLNQEMEDIQRRFVDFAESRRFFTEYTDT
jgi:hypothetical protein